MREFSGDPPGADGGGAGSGPPPLNPSSSPEACRRIHPIEVAPKAGFKPPVLQFVLTPKQTNRQRDRHPILYFFRVWRVAREIQYTNSVYVFKVKSINYFRRRNFSTSGKKVINRGDSFRSRNSSLNSSRSR